MLAHKFDRNYTTVRLAAQAEGGILDYCRSPWPVRLGEMMDEDAHDAKKVPHEVGMVLDALSVGELETRIGVLEAEIARLRAEIERKHEGRSAADSIFKI